MASQSVQSLSVITLDSRLYHVITLDNRHYHVITLASRLYTLDSVQTFFFLKVFPFSPSKLSALFRKASLTVQTFTIFFKASLSAQTLTTFFVSKLWFIFFKASLQVQTLTVFSFDGFPLCQNLDFFLFSLRLSLCLQAFTNFFGRFPLVSKLSIFPKVYKVWAFSFF